MDKNEELLNGGFTKMNQYTYKLESRKLSGMSKLIYLIICAHQYGYDKFTPGVRMMSKCYGIGSRAYEKAKRELAFVGLITIKKADHVGCRDEISVTDKGDLGKYEEIPNALLHSPCFTPQQKLFLCFLYHVMYYDSATRSRTVTMSANGIAEVLKNKGIARGSVLNCLRELSSNSYVKILTNNIDGYSLNLHVIIALFQFNPKLSSRYHYPEYKKVYAGDYSYDGETGSIIKK